MTMSKKILIYTENYARGGGNRYLVDIINALPLTWNVLIVSNENGVYESDFDLINRSYEYRAIKIFSMKCFEVVLLKIRKKSAFIFKILRRLLPLFFLFLFKKKNINILFHLLDEINPDLVISCNGGYPGAFSCLDLIYACKKRNQKYLLSIVSMPIKLLSYRIHYSNLSNKIENVIVNSSMIKNELISNFGFMADRISVVYNSVDKIEIEVPLVKKNEDNLILGYIGRIERSKGAYVLLDAMKNITNLGLNVHLLMIGGGDELEQVKQYSINEGLSDSVLFTGYLNDNIYDLLKKIDIFVFPSFWEGLPYSLLEAMNAGKIIVSSNVGGIPEIIVDRESGILVPPNDVEKLSNTLIEVVKNVSNYSFLGINARKTIKSNFLYENFVMNINKVIGEV